jgi:hypothetical protein
VTPTFNSLVPTKVPSVVHGSSRLDRSGPSKNLPVQGFSDQISWRLHPKFQYAGRRFFRHPARKNLRGILPRMSVDYRKEKVSRTRVKRAILISPSAVPFVIGYLIVQPKLRACRRDRSSSRRVRGHRPNWPSLPWQLIPRHSALPENGVLFSNKTAIPAIMNLYCLHTSTPDARRGAQGRWAGEGWGD